MDIEEKIALLTRFTDELVTQKEAENLLAQEGKVLKAYVGIEPSGLFHIGQALILSRKLKDLQELGFEITILLADWHAFINDKLGGSMENIAVSGAYLKDCFNALGVENVKFLYANEMVGDKDYWEIVLRIAKASSISRIKRAMTIMGRKEDEAESDSSKLLYPSMQAADIFYLKVDLALGGMDQRHAHMLARDAADKLKWKKPVALHTPLLTGLQGGTRMDTAKMSKSKPDTCIFIHDSPEEIKRKLKKAFCPMELEGNPVLDHCKYIVFPFLGELKITRPEKFGGDMTITSQEELVALFSEEKLHPMDLKNAVTDALIEILAPVREYFDENSGNYEALKKIVLP